ncbi:LysE family translocator [Vibrio parahaemolyticus]|uniref:LysE family translocator n=1 Tax=Vibrio parahaemolyticus TaxID=670 RepID=UPI000676F99C|nr:LysE family translocator [Vibrio parahaemolyticus]EIU7004877.1 LysE family translocator [Vibrio parahaemolyticus]EJE8675086.1 LysE family translocator [Vibrio parahaemolyticus]
MDINWFLFLTAALTVNAIPGADVVYVISTNKHNGMSAAKKSMFGLFLGYLFHVVIMYVGISQIIAKNDILFSIVKYLGSAYLLYLGVTMIMEVYRGEVRDGMSTDNKTIENENNSFVVKGFLISALNPKVSLFFLSFIPQFIDQTNNNSMIILILGLIFSIGATFFNYFYCLISDRDLKIKNKAIKYCPGIVLSILGIYTAI